MLRSVLQTMPLDRPATPLLRSAPVKHSDSGVVPFLSSMISRRGKVILGRVSVAALIFGAVGAGCGTTPRRLAENRPLIQNAGHSGSQPADDKLDAPAIVESVDARCPVPLGWAPEPLKQGGNNKHQIWVSPTKSTAYGVLFVTLPLPAVLVPAQYRLEKSLDAFLREMKKREGRADLIESSEDPALDGIRFVVEGGQYKVRANLLVRGTRAWFVYAGTRQGQPFEPDELAVAERARDRTEVDANR